MRIRDGHGLAGPQKVKDAQVDGERGVRAAGTAALGRSGLRAKARPQALGAAGQAVQPGTQLVLAAGAQVPVIG
ncbi:hypothetical protein, partial [Streptomyces nitrosporeus]|uniref:hypothetical protein n=1 Tax=Streptomyces nitrosporeus TaxID=28894 RepID=UPI0039A0CB64